MLGNDLVGWSVNCEPIEDVELMLGAYQYAFEETEEYQKALVIELRNRLNLFGWLSLTDAQKLARDFRINWIKREGL